MAVVGAIGLGACNDATNPPPPSPVPYVTPSSVAWTDCGDGFQCGAVAVPIDYANPTHGTIRIALARKPATDPSHRIGSLLLNPGGPGGSGITFVRYSARLMAGLNARFDLVGFDPRGVGQSAPVRCLSGPQTDAADAIDPVLDDAQERKTYLDSLKAYAKACERTSGRVLQFVDTASAAKDMDVLRAALGDTKLTYYGLSYGTFLGQMYAHLFPNHVRALALDAVFDPALTFSDRKLQTTAALEANLQAFLAYCRSVGSCQLATSGDPAEKLYGLMDRLDRQPLTVGHRRLTRSLALEAVLISLYSPRAWDILQSALAAADQGEGLALLEISDAVLGRHSDGSYTNFQDADAAIFCADNVVASDVASYDDLGAQLSSLSALFGPALQYSGIGCSYWPVKPSRAPGPLAAIGAPPILLVGGTGDPATPYASAVAVNKELAGSVLLTRIGYGHGSYGQSECVREATDAYLIDLTLPAPNTVCQSDA
ncbi:MAG TPA: alpha/beta hydrolase [Candidatus Dormibacteraeota bacterium]|nr:alpha/beta hydrolase [Candidatus Dormibacteraeota bacterium]